MTIFVEVYGSDGHPHTFAAPQVRDSDKLSVLANSDWWGVRNDCNGLFSIHRHRDEAIAEAANLGMDCYVVPLVIFYDRSPMRF